ncbi:MAG: sigma-70 family RNA polymerase sigma factor [Pseudomonadota bacterium]
MDKAAFDALYRAHYRRVFGICRRLLGEAGSPEDAAQEVFMRGFKTIGRYDESAPFGPWIGAIARNHCIDQLRKRQRLKTIFADAEAPAEALEDPADNAIETLISDHDAGRITAAVDALPESYRLPIVLAYYGDASYEEIAANLNITPNHVGVLLLRGRQRLRKLLDTDQGEETQNNQQGERQ